jgi:hypothetical protein
MGSVIVRSWVDLPDIRRGEQKRLELTSRIQGLINGGKLQIIDNGLRAAPGISLHPSNEPAWAGRPASPSGTIRAVLDWVGSDPDRAASALISELGAERPRKTLIAALEDLGSQDLAYQAMTGSWDDDEGQEDEELLGDLSGF